MRAVNQKVLLINLCNVGHNMLGAKIGMLGILDHPGLRRAICGTRPKVRMSHWPARQAGQVRPVGAVCLLGRLGRASATLRYARWSRKRDGSPMSQSLRL